MAFTTREIESPDPVTRAVAAEAEVRQSGDDTGEKLVLELDGEIITNATPDVGFLHRGDEKNAENMQYNQFVPYTDRLDYIAPLSNNVAYVLYGEKLMGRENFTPGTAFRGI